MNNNNFDVIVMGGGPAGSSVAGMLAREGRRVILFEKEVFPRHHIGESLMTDTYWTFRRLGLLEKLKDSPFVRKYSVQFANSAGKESRPFYFFEAVHHESAVTWQVTRAKFDHLLIDHAAELEEFRRAILDSELGHFIRGQETSWGEAKNVFRGFEIAH